MKNQLRSLGLVAALAVAGSAPATAQTLHEVSLSHALVSVQGEEIVLTMVASGDLSGHLTITLAGVDESGRGFGEWALVVAYVADLDEPTGTEAPHTGEEPAGEHHERIELVNEGTLSGSVAGAEIGVDAAGAPVAIRAELPSLRGSLSFEGVSGSGWLEATALGQTAAASGALSLSF